MITEEEEQLLLSLSQVCNIDIWGQAGIQVGQIDSGGEPLILGGVQDEAVPQPVELEGEVYGATDDAGTEHSLQNIHLVQQLYIRSL